MTQYRTMSSSQARSGAPLVLAAACGLALAAPAAAQLTEPFPALFELESLLPAGGGDGSLGFHVASRHHSVSSAGDINGDGIDDIIVAGAGGVASVIFGRSSGFPAVVNPADLDGTNGFRVTNARATHSVAGVGDVNGDGVDDIIVEPGVIFGRAGGGFAAQIDLATLDGENGFRLTGVEARSTGGGDINGDGLSDILLASGGSTAYIVFGRSGPFPASIDVGTLDGSTGFAVEGAVYGVDSVASAGDINGDGIDDLALGGPGEYLGYYGTCYCGDPGAAYVVFGRSTFPRALHLGIMGIGEGFRISGFHDAMAGASISGAGDVNADGIDDLLIGAPGGIGVISEAFLLFGRDTATGPGFPASLSLSTFSAEHGVRLKGDPGDGAGASVAGVGDVNGDGVDDIVIGAPYCRDIGSTIECDRSYVVFGSASSLPDTVDLTQLDGEAGFQIDGGGGGWILSSNGEGVAPAGDVNADGIADFMVVVGDAGTPPKGAYIIFGRMPDAPCYADCDGSGELDFFDFLCFQNLFAAGDPQADCDESGELDFFDFLCFQNAFAAGCP